MKKVFNVFFSIIKYLLLLAAFALTLYIILKMNLRLKKPIIDSISLFIPYGVLLLLYILNFSLNKKSVNDNLFFNLTSVLTFLANIIVCLRAMFDYNMVFNGIQKMGVDFNYFNDYLSFNKIMLYGLIIADIIFMFIPNNIDDNKNNSNINNNDNNKINNNTSSVVSSEEGKVDIEVL